MTQRFDFPVTSHLPDMNSSPQVPVGRIAVLIALAAATVLAFHFTSSVNGATESGVVMELPVTVGRFTGKVQEISEGERFVLPKDTEIVKKAYTDPSGDMLNAQIVLSGAEKRSIHRPELCLPAQGWTINRQEVLPVTLADGRRITVMKNTVSRPVEVRPGVTRPLTSLYCYWFVGKDVSTPSHFMRVFLTSWDRIFHHRNHRWAYVAVSAPVLEGFTPGGRNPEGTQNMITGFISEMGPAVMKGAGEKAVRIEN